jgi:cyanate permease
LPAVLPGFVVFYWLTDSPSRAMSVGGIAVINTQAQVRGFIGPSSVGIIRDQTVDFSLALVVLARFALLATFIAYRFTTNAQRRKLRQRAYVAKPHSRGAMTRSPLP